MSEAKRRAPLSLRFVVIGGNIAGLACAYALREAGHQVCVLEKYDGTTLGNTSICSPPNMTRILQKWGLGPRLGSFRRSGLLWRLCDTGEKVGMHDFPDWIMKALAADFLMVKHSNVYNFLYELALQAGVELHFNSEVVEVDAGKASVVLASGEVFQGDVLIGADGINSLVRECIPGANKSDGSIRLQTGNAMVSVDDMMQDEDLKPLLDKPLATLWMGDGYALWGCPSDDYRAYTLKFAWPDHSNTIYSQYEKRYSAQDINLDFKHLEPRLVKLIGLTDKISPISWIYRDVLESLVHENGKVLLVGSAAHVIPPNLTHNTAVAIEDAESLGTLFSRIRSREQIPRFVSAYNDLRQARSVDVVQSEISKMEFITMPHGEMQAMRDQRLRTTLVWWSSKKHDRNYNDSERADDGQWEEYIRLFNYDANEAVDDWWQKWGGLMEENALAKDVQIRVSLELSE